jgi:hypothetical protein
VKKSKGARKPKENMMVLYLRNIVASVALISEAHQGKEHSLREKKLKN